MSAFQSGLSGKRNAVPCIDNPAQCKYKLPIDLKERIIVDKHMGLTFFVGTVAELIKLFPIMTEAQQQGIEYQIVSSGQNDIRESEFWNLIKKKSPDILISRGPRHQTAISLMAWFLCTAVKSFFLFKKKARILNGKPILIVHGDTISTLMGAYTGWLAGYRICHVEAGLRSFDFLNPFPEEICRVLVSKVSSIAFCPNDWAMNNLKRYRGIKYNTRENTLLDSLNIAVNDSKINALPELPEKYFLFILHRQENLYRSSFVLEMIKEVEKRSRTIPCVLILHSPTKMCLKKLGVLHNVLQNKNIYCIPRQPYMVFTQLLHQCSFIVTDGGSNQEESYYLGKPCLLLRFETERIEGLNRNVVLSKNQFDVMEHFFKNFEHYGFPAVQPLISPSKLIITRLSFFLKKDKAL